MNFVRTVNTAPFILTEGAVIERLKRETSVQLDPSILHAGLIYHQKGKKVLTKIYRQYIEVGLKYDVPMIVSAPTWRAGPARVLKSEFRDRKHINEDCIHFIQSLIESSASQSKHFFVGGLMACKGDSYKSEEALTTRAAENYHQSQARALSDSGVDFIMGATLPAVSEALGMAAAIAAFGLPYVLSFVIRPDGTILDGTPLHKAIAAIDSADFQEPLFYMVNCVHPTILDRAMEKEVGSSKRVLTRLIGIQANTSAKSPEELDGLEKLDGSDPEGFSKELLALHQKFGTKIIGGCCGTDQRHIAAIARRLRRLYR